MDFPPDWDLLALVRSCSSTTTAVTTTSSPPQQPPLVVPQQERLCCFSPTPSTSSSSSLLFGFSSPLHTTSFSSSSLTSPVSTSSSSIFTAGRSLRVGQLCPDVRRLVRPSHRIFEETTGATSQSQRPKKRKNLMKKVCHIPAEGLSSDMWAWRKYGQKPIKGSPYPRGYYRCSSSKGCLARKRVERNRTDPKMLIVTYTSEHNHPIPAHRNTLAGSTRQKTMTSTGTPPEQSTVSPSTVTEKSESKTEGEDVTKDLEGIDIEGFSDLMFNDEFFVGFEKIDGRGSDDSDCFSEQFSPAAEFRWPSNGSTAAGEV